MLQEEESGVIMLVNKWDAVEKDTYSVAAFTEEVRKRFDFLPYAPVLFISAESGQRVNKILPMVKEVQEARHKRIPTGQLNRLVRDAVARHPPPAKGGQAVKFLYTAQADAVPPTFIFFVNKPELIHFTYERYLENRIREAEPFTGTPIRLRFRARSEERTG
jgi:GTP-binding protein